MSAILHTPRVVFIYTSLFSIGISVETLHRILFNVSIYNCFHSFFFHDSLAAKLHILNVTLNKYIHIRILDTLAVSEIKLLFCALTGCTSPKTVHPEIGPCTPQYIVIINSSKNVHTLGAHLRKPCTRPWKCARRVQGAPLISDTVMHI